MRAHWEDDPLASPLVMEGWPHLGATSTRGSAASPTPPRHAVRFSLAAELLVDVCVDTGEVDRVAILPSHGEPHWYEDVGVCCTDALAVHLAKQVKSSTWKVLEQELPPGITWEG